ncbi:MAG: Heparinase family protein, partial [Bacilli bacterium]|nr:Heparinase family protein [Bacilli bacterium]
VCVAQAGLAVLSILGEVETAEEWLEEVNTAFPEFFHYKGSVLGNKSPNFDEQGAFYESVNYTNYGLGEYLLFRLALSNMSNDFSQTDNPLLENAAEFFIQSFYPTEDSFLTVNFGDGDIHSGAVEAVKMLLANHYEKPELRWYLQCAKPEFNAFDLIYYDQIWNGASNPPSPTNTSASYEEIGWAIMRSSWEKDATLLAIKSGFTWNHAHADAGSFLLCHQGQPMIIDSGNCSYGRPEYQGYYCQSQAHNVILFNGQGQNREDISRGVKEPGQLYHLIDHSGLRYIYADATGPMSHYFSRNFRHFIWVEGVILIFDDLRAHEEGTLQWLLHFDGQANKESNGDYRISNDKSQVVIRSLFPRQVKVSNEEGLADHDPDRKMSYYSFATPTPTREAKFVTAIMPVCQGTKHSLPEVEPIEGDNMIGVRVIHAGKQTDIYLNLRADGRVMHRNSINRLGGWETDAYLLAVTRQLGCKDEDVDTIERCFMAHGSYIRRNEKVLFTSLTKVTTAFSWNTDDVLELSLQGQPSIRAEVYTPYPTSQVNLNGCSSVCNYSSQTRRVKVNCLSQKSISRRPG